MANVTMKNPAAKSYCMLCRMSFNKTKAHKHMQSLKHHRELEAVTGTDYTHECQACGTSHIGLKCYARHISTPKHKANMKRLFLKNKKPIFVEWTLDNDTLSRIRIRNKKLRLSQKKKRNKTKKHNLQQQKTMKPASAEERQKNINPGQNQKQVKRQQPLVKTQPKTATSQPEPKGQNKENRLAGRLGWLLPGYPSTNQHHGGGKSVKPESLSRNKQSQATQSTSSKRKGHNKSITSGSCNNKYQNKFTRDDDNERFSLAGKLEKEKKNPQGAKPVNHTPNKSTMSISRDMCHYSSFTGSGTDLDYTNDDLPEAGSITFHTWPVPNIPERAPDSGESALNTPVSTCRLHDPNPGHSQVEDKNMGPIRSEDVTVMLHQIRRALGRRDPARASSEAQTQPHRETNTELSKATVDPMSDTKRQISGDSAAQGRVPRCRTLELPPSLSRHISEAGPQPNLNTACRIRNANESWKGRAEKEAALKPTMQKLLSSSGSQRKVNCKMYQEATRKNQETVKGIPRFCIELVHHLSNSEGLTVDEEIPLSRHYDLSPPPAQTSPDGEGESGAQRVEQPSVASGFPVSLKAESSWGHGDDGVVVHRARKRCNTVGRMDSELPGVSADHSAKRQKGKLRKDSGQVDQLLAVSLKEEELSRSMLAVDVSLIQARSALQAAYTEVQRLLLVKQQVIGEVSGLRARRIEILQGMQVGYSVVTSNDDTATALSTHNSPAPVLSNPYMVSSILPPIAFSPPLSTLTASLHPLGPLPLSLPPTINPDPQNLSLDSLPSQILKQANVFPPSLETVAVIPNLQRAIQSPSAPITTPVPPSVAQQMPPTAPSDPASPLVNLPAVSPPNNQREVNVTAAPTVSKSVDVRDDKLRLEIKRSLEDSSSSDSEEDLEGPIKDSVASESLEDSDCSIQIVETTSASRMEEVVAIEDSDSEDDRGSPAPPQASSTPRGPLELSIVEVSSSSTQTRAPPGLLNSIKQDPHKTGPSDGEPSLGFFEGHTGPVHGLQIHEGLLYTCSGDNTARAFNLQSRQCQAVFEGHTNKINCLLVSSLPGLPSRLYTGSSDQTVRCYSIKSMKCLEQISLPDRVLCLHTAWKILYVGLANGSVVNFELKTQRELDVFECHGPRGVSCLGTAQEGSRRVLLVGSYDSSISVRDAHSGLLLRSLQGHTKTVLCMKVVNDLVFSGSSDTSVHAHNIHNGELVRIYKGHGHAVTALAILGKVMVTASLDKLVRVYELQSHDRLQVYGGHTDMVMCMAIHKSVIYTGCYNGTVQAVKLNLIENYRCWWQGCSLIFAVADHLVQHLLSDHSNAQLQNVKCRWKSCDAFFSAKQSSLKELPGHMQSHVKKDSKLET
ncbi:zinc finger protein 106 isoform X2 [Hypomesus transpacificus]|uniref:zinc finger protein 106 isoform X2 n=1 Tax=Hypomesus transpacificus TaxID=137520 RepID=UPI001F076B80|nr:zinc finger protein 106 isoform X2 [Hypomesus transpacificus]